MAANGVTVAIPVRDGGPLLGETLAAVRGQDLDRPLELLVADSGSRDGSREVARAHGAEVIEVDPDGFSHGGTRNLLAERASGAHVAFLTQDSVPADDRWLARLLECFDLASDVALAFGPYLARPGAPPTVRRELDEFFASFSEDGSPRVDRAGEPGTAADRARRGFFTDANGCVLKAAWRETPFRLVPYAEDQLLARDMLAAGHAKVFHPGAAVVHSHEYGTLELFKRAFDEGRGLREVHDRRTPLNPVAHGLSVQRSVRDDLRFVRAEGGHGAGLVRAGMRSALHHLLRASGDALGSHADRLSPALRRACSLERRSTFEPVRDT